MSATIKIDVKVETPDKETVTDSQTLEVEAYDKVEVKIPTGETGPVEVQPSAKGQVRFLLIKADADKYGGLSYTVEEPSGSTSWIDLRFLHVLPDNGLLHLLPNDPKKFWFRNVSEEERTVVILVGRAAAGENESSGDSENQGSSTGNVRPGTASGSSPADE